MRVLRIFFILWVVLYFASCSKKTTDENFNSDVSLYSEYIHSFTSGIVSSQSDFRVVLAFEKGDWEAGQELDKKIFAIQPSVKGKVVALSQNTVAFVPDEKLPQDTEFRITFQLSKLIKTPDELSEFRFTVKTIKQDFIIHIQDLQSYSKDWQYLNGVLQSSDELEWEVVEKVISVSQGSRKLHVKWNQSLSGKQSYHFLIDSIQRFEEDSNIRIQWDGTPFKVDQKGESEFEIPGKNNFKIVGVEVEDSGTQALVINFSDPVKKNQDLRGLVAVEGTSGLKFVTEGNLLKVFFTETLKGDLLVEVFQGIQSQDGYKMKETYTEKVSFEQIKPAVRFVKSGTILPSSQNLKLNFESVNLRAVDVKVYRIFQNNILQFLQDNSLDGRYSLRKVALPVAEQTIDLQKNNWGNYAKWNVFALDLAAIITPEPGAIYRVEVSFKRAYSLYKCEEPSQNNQEDSSVDYYYDEEEDEGYYYGYDWRERENPCSASYYYDRKIGTNILASDIGVIAKRGENNTYFFAVTNIMSTNPVQGAKVSLYNYQQQKLVEGITNGEGWATFQQTVNAYFAVVTHSGQTTYVKLDDGNSLSVSNFDVAGVKLQKGLKGYIYGDRGVWRPGDTLFVSFMLNDAAAKLDPSHPIQLKVNDPNGKLIYQSVQKSNPVHHYTFAVPTLSEQATGSWEAIVQVGGAKFYKSLKVETIKPNRLKIRYEMDSEILTIGKPNLAKVSVNWLHGAAAKDLKLEVQGRFSKQKTAFKGYSQYVFDDPARDFYAEDVPVFSGKVDADGKAVVNIQPKIGSQAPGMLKATFLTKAYEKGGDFSTDVMSMTISPYDTYIGLKSPDPNKYGLLETRKNNRFEVIALDEKGKPATSRKLEATVYKIDWRWWWDASHDNLSRFSSADVTTAFKSFKLTTDANGKAHFQFTASDEEWGRYLIRVSDPNGGHATGQTVLIDWPYWSGKTRNTDTSHASMLVFTTDKKEYKTGEKAQISFPSSAGGRALVSIENGTGVLQTYWVATQKEETKVEVPITPEMAPNVYINISLLQPHASTVNDLPVRMYGIVPIEVVDKNTILQPKIEMPDVLKPEQKVAIKVSESSGRAMTYTLAVVDEGLLDLTRFKTPNAWNSFYAKEALGVKTWDIFDEVIGAYGGKVNQIFSIGGDEDLKGGASKKANRFKPIVIHLGPFTLEKGKSMIHTVEIPKYVGSVRTMVVAGDIHTEAYGNAEKTTPVRNPLMVLASLPRKVTQGEQIVLPATVFAMEKHIKQVTLQVKAVNGIKVVGESSQTVNFSRPDEQMAYFNLKAGDISGVAKVEVLAISGSEKASYQVELDVVNPNPVTHSFTDLVLGPGETKTLQWETFGVDKTNAARLEISSFPTIDFNRRLDYLIRYPHGCLEQKTSGVFPQLYLADVVDLTGKQKSDIEKNIKTGILKLSEHQLSNGGFSYWPGKNTADDWSTSYVGHFMIEAEKKGYVLPIQMKSKWITYQQQAARQWRYHTSSRNDWAQAYRLYTLALAGSADLASMNRLRETVGISNESKLRLAAAYALAGQKSAGKNLLQQSDIEVSNQTYYYGSAERNRAMMLETLVILDDKAKAFETANKLAKALSGDQWMSTQTTAYALYAMSRFAQKNGGKGIQVSYSQERNQEAIQSGKPFADRVLAVQSGVNKVTVSNKDSNTLYVRVVNSGILPVGQEKEVQSKLTGSIVFKTRNGSVLDVDKVVQGTEFIAEVTVVNQSGESVENVALTQIFPSGFEIVNMRFTDFGGFAPNKADYIDFRDDRAMFYFGLKARESKTFRVLLNASYPGRYYMAGIQAEAMYDYTYLIRTKGKWIEVIQ